jgi:hypothetical protein
MGYFLRCHRLHENCVSQSTHKVVTSCFPHSDVCCCVSRRTGPNSPRVISGVLSSQAHGGARQRAKWRNNWHDVEERLDSESRIGVTGSISNPGKKFVVHLPYSVP